MYCKRILIFQQTDGRFAERGKELCGLVKFVNNDETKVTVFVTNANIATFGEWWVLLNCDGNVFARRLSTLNNDVFEIPLQKLENVGALLVKREDRCFEAAFAQIGSQALCSALRRNLSQYIADYADFSAYENYGPSSRADRRDNPTSGKSADKAKFAVSAASGAETDRASRNPQYIGEKTDFSPYEKFVEETENYYGIEDVEKLKAEHRRRYDSVRDYSDAFERYYATGAETAYYQSVKKEIGKVFVQFPPYYPLIRRYAHSFFVRIDFPSSDKYFVLGILQKDGVVRYICYGLPAEKDGFSDKDFVFVDNSPTNFWMLFQDAETGQITTLNI